jgi:hypothetical protein
VELVPPASQGTRSCGRQLIIPNACLGVAEVACRFFRTFDQATASVCMTCG